MLKTLFTSLVFAVVFTSGTAGQGSEVYSSQKKEPKVYVCTGPKAYVYHFSASCGGLKKCSDEVIAVSVSKAQSMGRKACKKCS